MLEVVVKGYLLLKLFLWLINVGGSHW